MTKDDRQNEMKKRRALLFSRPLDERGIEVLEKRFECNLPCFQGSIGKYDPLDAMRRDAYREVCLWLRDQLNIFKQENS